MKPVVLILFLTVALPAFAQERYSFYQGVRQMGMGGASVAVVNDETALLANPAALGKLRDHYVTVVDPDVEVGTHTQQVTNNNVMGMTNPQTALDDSLKHPDKHLNEKAQIFPSIVVPNFGMGLFAKYQIDGQYNSTTTNFEYDYTNDYAAVFGFDFRFWNGVVKIGTNVRVDNRTEVHNSGIAGTSTGLTLSQLASSGVGVGSDTGILITAPVKYLPTLGAVYRDVGGTSYDLRQGLFMKTAAFPDMTPQTVDVGLSIHPILGNHVLTLSKETEQMRRVHAGFEFNFADAIFLRGGLNQRYWTAGLELAVGHYQFQAASYGEDIGVPGTPVEDRRYEVKFAFRF
jgi:hypothetical protein